MSEFLEALKPRRLGAEILARVARERRDGELTWVEGGKQRKIYFVRGRPELVVDRDGNESGERANVIAVVRAFATASSGQAIFELPARPIEARLNIDTLGETLVALAKGLRPDQLEAIWAARRTETVESTPGFDRFATAIAQVGGAKVAAPKSGITVGALIAGAPEDVQRTWVTLISLGALHLSRVPTGETPAVSDRGAPRPVMASPLPQPRPEPAPRAEAPAATPPVTGRSDDRVASGPLRALVLPDNFEARGLALEIEKVHRQLPGMDLYQVLGVDKNASADTVKSAYFEEAKRWHSDRFAAVPIGPDFVAKAEEIFRRCGEARDVLSDPGKRKSYDFLKERKAQGLPTDPSVIMEAEGLFIKGQTMVRRGQAAAAEPFLRRAVELNKGEAEFWAYFGFAVYSAKGKAGLKEARDAIKKAGSMNDKLAVVDEFLGRIAHAEGEIKEAKRLLQSALDQNPKSIDAERELRLINLRHSKDKPGGAKKGLGGLLDGLLKK